MSIYIHIMVIAIQARFQYRLELLFNLIIGIIPLIAIISLWFSLFENKSVISTYTLNQIVTYTVIAKILEQVLLPSMHWNISDEIQTGEIAKFLVKPVSHYYYWLYKCVGEKVVSIVVSLVPLTFVAIVLLEHINMPGIKFIPFFIMSVVFAFVLYFLIYYTISLLSFWLVDITAFFYTLDIVIEFMSGVFIPLDLFPKMLQTILQYLPFHYMIYFPVKIYLSQISINSVMQGLVIQIIWIMVFSVLVRILWIRGVRRYEAAGA